MTYRRRSIAAALCIAVAPTILAAQTWRTFDVARMVRDSQPLTVRVMYGAGRARVQPATDRRLFDMHLRYDASGVEPTYKFDAAQRVLDVGVRHTSAGRSARSTEGSELQLSLSPAVPLRIELDVGAAEGDYDLTGLQVDEVTLQTGATDTRMRFGAPNPRRMRSMGVQAGAAAVRITGLANANVERIDLNLGVGQAILDFSGEWRGDTRVSVSSALGAITLRVPDDVGIRVESSAFLHSLNAPALEKRDGHSVSANWNTATHKLYVHSNGAFGRLEIQRISR